MSGIHILMINPNDGSEIPDDIFRYNVPDEFQMGKQRLSGEVIECSIRELTGLDETFIICRVCFKIMHQPSALPCLHAFCLKCLFVCAGDYGMVCPLCMQAYTAPGQDLARLPRNSFIYHNLCVAVAGQQIDNAPCKICKLKPDEFCMHCDAYLCELCSIVCHRMNGKNNHDVMRLSKYKEMITQKKPDCANHNIIACGFCEECKTLICEKCEGHTKHTIKDVDHGVAYFKKATDELIVRYPYEKSLLYKTRVEHGLPVYAPSSIEPNRYKDLDLSTKRTPKSGKQTLSKEEIDQLKKDLANKTLPSHLSADKTMRISSFQTEDMNWDVFVPQAVESAFHHSKTPEDPVLAEEPPIALDDHIKLAELLKCKRPPIPIDTPEQLSELLRSNKTLVPINDPKKLAEILESQKPPMPVEDHAKLAEILRNRKTPLPVDDPEKLAELLQCKRKPIPIETPQQLLELLQTKKTLLPFGDPKKFEELMQSGSPLNPFGDPKQLGALLQRSMGLVEVDDFDDILGRPKGKQRSPKKQQSATDDSTKVNAEVTKPKEERTVAVSKKSKREIKKDIDSKSETAGGSVWNEKKLMMFNHVMGRSCTTPPDEPIDHFKSLMINSDDIDFDDVD